VVHDGPEYDALARLTTYLAVMIDRGELSPLRAALLAPGPRDDWYSGNGAYTRSLCLAVLPQLRAMVPTTSVVGMGASLGALAMMHAQRRHAGAFDALFLQSGSFFHPRFDAHERRFEHYERIVRGVDAVLRAGGHPSPVPVVLTCGRIEENLENNRVIARALAAQRYDVALHEVPDVHNYTAWRDSFHPYLTRLLRLVLA
jgi:enterochelin esterase family protein